MTFQKHILRAVYSASFGPTMQSLLPEKSTFSGIFLVSFPILFCFSPFVLLFLFLLDANVHVLHFKAIHLV